ncbi:hypothetical protein SFC79_08330 [Nocardioides sp. S-58]|uniref:Uncharacterized protein n=1 Tax=Nocardioides renjunii TaxID=3095075 RepID=A0ABU5KA39_9ACTN|nr:MULTISPECIES: hypothetical protein [unclassified Nocardioides]MDZ5661766.1 hypothetical protein [Nocardioides sp. S-58]WQQ24007.1 hypothetical protein SHK17_08455 [Nocardioides sp. S-34]
MSKVREAARGVVSRLQQTLAETPVAMDDEARSRWRSVTINRRQDEVMPSGKLPGPLAALGDSVEVEVRPAPGGKGTELAARLRTAGPTGPRSVPASSEDEDPRERVRSALREAKQLIEVGEVLRVDPAPHGHRPPTPGGKLVESATRHAGGEGVL